jgi:quinoprotein glucose dehydrogenase
MRNEGLFTPPGLYESLSLPGARGGANWGSTAANPSKGLVYLTTQDWPTIYKLSLEDPFAERANGGRGGVSDAGRAGYEQHCQSCHGGQRYQVRIWAPGPGRRRLAAGV